MFLNLILGHRFLGIWCLLVAFNLLGRSGRTATVRPHPPPDPRSPAPADLAGETGAAAGRAGTAAAGPAAVPSGKAESARGGAARGSASMAGNAADTAVDTAVDIDDDPGGRPAWPGLALLAAAGWAWAVVLARSLPPWRVTLSWAGEGMVLFDSRVPLWAALGLWGLWRRRPAGAADLAPYALAAALLADPEALSGRWLAGGFQSFGAGEGLPNLAVLLLPLLAGLAPANGRDPNRPGPLTSARPVPHPADSSGRVGGGPGKILFPGAGHSDGASWTSRQPMTAADPIPAEAPSASGAAARMTGGILVAACFWGIVPALAMAWAAAALPGHNSHPWRTAGLQALLVAAFLEWLETSALPAGSPAGALLTTLLFTLGRFLPIVGRMVS